MFSTSSYAGWTKVTKSENGHTFYVDFDRIRKHDGYVYFWELINFSKPISGGKLSTKIYFQVDCKIFQYKWLSISTHTEPMGGGTGGLREPSAGQKGWKYASPNSSIEDTLKLVCSQ